MKACRVWGCGHPRGSLVLGRPLEHSVCVLMGVTVSLQQQEQQEGEGEGGESPPRRRNNRGRFRSRVFRPRPSQGEGEEGGEDQVSVGVSMVYWVFVLDALWLVLHFIIVQLHL